MTPINASTATPESVEAAIIAAFRAVFAKGQKQ